MFKAQPQDVNFYVKFIWNNPSHKNTDVLRHLKFSLAVFNFPVLQPMKAIFKFNGKVQA